MSLKGAYKHIVKANRLKNDEDKKVRKSAQTAASHGEPCLSEERLKRKGYTPEQIHLYKESYEESAGSPETQRQRTLKRKAQQDKKYKPRKSRLPKQNVSEQVPQISSEEPILTLEIETWEDFQTQTPREQALSEQNILFKSWCDLEWTEVGSLIWDDTLSSNGLYFNFIANLEMPAYVEPEDTLINTQLSYSPLNKVDL